jgi:SpoVK/Ycf46/Vps4 family AAA+-type ATPase
MNLTPEEEKLLKEMEEYERWVIQELEAGNFVSVENLEEARKGLAEAADRALKRRELKLFFKSPEEKEKAIKVLKELFGEKFEIIEV